MSLKENQNMKSKSELEIIDVNENVPAEKASDNTTEEEIDLENDTSEEIGIKIVKNALKLPKVKVNREEFLRKTLKGKVSQEQIENAVKNGTSEAGIPLEIIKELAQKCILAIRLKSTAISAGTGLPGGPVGATAGLATDVTQFYANLIIIIQKLVYLYGMKEIADVMSAWGDIKDYDDEYAKFILIYIGAASGVEIAGVAGKVVLKGAQVQYMKQAGKFILISKPLFYSLAKSIAKRLGMSITKKGFAKAAAKAIPGISAFFSGAINWVAFKPLANNLDRQLSEVYDKPFDETLLGKLKEYEKNNNFFADSEAIIKENAKIYSDNKKVIKDRKRDEISQECLDFIRELCDEALFCKPDENIFKLVKVDKEDCFICHDDTQKSHTSGFVITSKGIYSSVSKEAVSRFISFKELAGITSFDTSKKKNPFSHQVYVEGRKNNVEIIPLIPCGRVIGGSKTIIQFLSAIRNACWVDLYM